jgi:hypothetical protein
MRVAIAVPVRVPGFGELQSACVKADARSFSCGGSVTHQSTATAIKFAHVGNCINTQMGKEWRVHVFMRGLV